ncbi:MAG: DNA alkylation repair protein [Devosiaceae bacterium]|nr:DNA alkylation repair protein [Devosiaceae bacterium]
MVEPFKNFFNPEMIARMGEYLRSSATGYGVDFDEQGFVGFCVEGIESRELKERSNRIVEGLKKYLPGEFLLAGKILVGSLDPSSELPLDTSGDLMRGVGIRGWAIMPMADYVGEAGFGHVDEALEILRELTCRWSSEFGIRPFFRDHPEQALSIVGSWLGDDNFHVRRLISEGSRPRLPWGLRLHNFIEDPAPVIKLLEQLKDDPSEYVRRSVANNLNDIAKDHPDLVAELAKNWLKNASSDRKRLVRHALRSLIKQGHKGALQALGYGDANIEINNFKVLTPEVTLGGALEFELNLASVGTDEQALIIDYVVHHIKANGKTSGKVFKWKNTHLKSGAELSAQKRHPMKPITTRKYYGGGHRVEILINGETVCGADFELKLI